MDDDEVCQICGLFLLGDCECISLKSLVHSDIDDDELDLGLDDDMDDDDM